MNKFVSKAVKKIDQLDSKEIIRIINDLDGDVKMLQTVLESMRDGVILCKRNGIILYANQRCPKMVPMFLPSRSGDYEGMSIDRAIDDKNLLCLIHRHVQGEITQDVECDYQRGDAVKTISVQVVKNEALRGDSFLVILTDVTEKNLSAAKLHQSEYLASMTTMAASIAHEIKNPLAAMSIHVQLLERKLQKNGSVTKDEAERYLKVLDEEINRLNGIAVDFLFAVRPLNTQLRLGDITGTIGEVIDFVKPELAEQKVRVVMHIGSSIPHLEYDEKLITQVLLNLIKNAMNAMKEGGTLTVSLSLDGDQVLLKVEDTGIGIPPADLSKIFEPYFTTKSDGTGLGLTIVYKVMKEHRGDVSVQSTVGSGTCFTLSFPVPDSQRLTLPKNEMTIESPTVEVKE